jgi:transcription-repair coupling factor (superfamily II helicase)
MLDSRKKVKDDTQKKLEVMQNLDSLGVGFTVASHDMDIRGSGNLLGDEQSGHVKETGVELYQQMLLETIEELKSNMLRQAQHDVTPSLSKGDDFDYSIQIKLGISLLIPEEYMQDLSLRMSFYKKIAAIKSDEDATNLIDEMNDRFGKIPQEISNLIEVAKIKHACKKLGIEKIEIANEGVLIGFKNNQFNKPEKLLEMIFANKHKIRLHVGQKVLFLSNISSVENKISSTFAAIKKLEEL